MVEKKYTGLLMQILDLLNTSCQASLELLARCREADTANRLLSDLDSAVETIRAAQEPLLPCLEHACTEEMLENVTDTLERVRELLARGEYGRGAEKIEFQLFPFLRQLREAFYFWGTVYPDKARMERYYREEFARNCRNLYIQGEEAPPVTLSVVVTGYNHLETTKRCIDRLLRETDFGALDAELILIDHGSTDGTLEYFESLGAGKVIRFKRNVRMYMFSTLFQICRGRYFCFVSNDILVTRDWAEILLKCLESDPRIIAAVPATPNIANLQMPDSPTNDPDEFTAWADRQNKSDPPRWNDRARLMPPLGMYRSAAVNEIGFADPYFHTMEFWDDDFSLRARRAGYRQIVCSDVACYHFGSVTGKEAQRKENTLVHGRELFRRKHGVDAWGSGFCYDYSAIRILKQLFGPKKELKVLGLDCGMGDMPMQIKNELRHLHRGCGLYQLTSQEEYLADIAPHSDEARFVPELAGGLDASFGAERFDLAWLGREIGEYEYFSGLLEAVSRRLLPGGWFVFTCGNPFCAVNLHALLQFSLPGGTVRHVLADPERIRAEAERRFSHVQVVPLESPVSGIEDFAALHYGKTGQRDQITCRLKVSQYYFLCRK